jgi:Zn-dependent peptidase ImmA (M78 family)/transcriptional regulator with XRE-family HTH domain
VDDAAAFGARIRALRERAGLKAQELAALIGLDPSAMSNIETGKRSVKTQELAAIASALSVSPLALLEEESLLARLPVAPRVVGEIESESEVLSRLTALTELHEVLADAGMPSRPSLEDIPEISIAAWKASAELLAHWAEERLQVSEEGDERFAALVEAIEDKLGVDVLIEDFRSDGLIGAAITDETFPFIFVNASQTGPRALFTLAHELAHVLLQDGEVLTLDADLSSRNEQERFANAFAATYLMPEVTVRTMILNHGRSVDALALMMKTFGVSYESLVYRLHNLRIINAKGRDTLQAIGGRNVISHIEKENPDLARQLLRQLSTRPQRRPPSWLTMRTYIGYQNGLLSVRPFAGLIDEDPDDLLEYLHEHDTDRDLSKGQYDSLDPEVTDEDLFSGSPL